jgi:hypothetical protein
MNCKMRYLVTYNAYQGNTLIQGSTCINVSKPIRNMKSFNDIQEAIKDLLQNQQGVSIDKVVILNIQLLNSGRKIRRR